jgi:ATP-binding cassette, subfamily B, bacterial MsbA
VLIAEVSHVTFQILSGIKIIKAFGGEQREVDRLAEANRRYIREVRKIQRLAALSKGLMDLLQMSGGAALIYFGGRGVLEGGVTLGDLMAFMLVVQLVYNASKELTGTANKVIEGTPAVMRVFEVLDEPDTIVDGPRTLTKAPLHHGVELRDVRFGYLENEVLRGVSLQVPAGKVVALVGPTGAGKTTICDVVARFYDVTSGSVLFDGIDVRQFTKRSLVGSIAVVTQDAFLFNTTVEENIRYGRADATREEVEAAARDAFVHDDIEAMDGGYRKVCGERGTALSGGQRQRITIARAILKDAPLLILDEATSNLDSRSEAMVQAALAKLMAGRTVIVVAHRLSTIRNADKVVVLEHGQIVEEGAPSELLARPGSRFKAMYDLQMGERDAEPGSED